ncbi:forkhead box protein I3-like [Ochotona princeps]|uniref:forkhead box protein I3-like n=1 Tax=Ochotona princeps TaxID=9978 RepID=UPI002714D2EE|nr:forkhead box protein I3-like [Ochotona princeps]XP_058520118.1 forkhead box protein I3-like [Ochotona princeps]
MRPWSLLWYQPAADTQGVSCLLPTHPLPVYPTLSLCPFPRGLAAKTPSHILWRSPGTLRSCGPPKRAAGCWGAREKRSLARKPSASGASRGLQARVDVHRPPPRAPQSWFRPARRPQAGGGARGQGAGRASGRAGAGVGAGRPAAAPGAHSRLEPPPPQSPPPGPAPTRACADEHTRPGHSWLCLQLILPARKAALAPALGACRRDPGWLAGKSQTCDLLPVLPAPPSAASKSTCALETLPPPA